MMIVHLVSGMMLFYRALLISLLLPVVLTQFNLYDTNRVLDTGQLQFDCLHYYVRSEGAGIEFGNSMHQVIKYCIRPVDKIDVLLPEHGMHGNLFTFAQLRQLNVTAQQFLSWSASVDLVEQYLLYLNQSLNNISLTNESFYNCTGLWFGTRCQYLFAHAIEMSFSTIVETAFSQTERYAANDEDLLNLTCYNHLKCDRGGSYLCLDWREICNGQIDCIDGEADELQCLEMEMNECDEGEYRCHNGLCIPEGFWHDDENNPDCLDRSDEPESPSSFDLCFQNPTFRCEEHSCRPEAQNFPCGDGQCVVDPHLCANGRTHLLAISISVGDGLIKQCWIHLTCLTLFTYSYNRPSCDVVIPDMAERMRFVLSFCKPLFQFPTTYIFNGHIRFFYQNNQSASFFVERHFPTTPFYDFNYHIPTKKPWSLGSIYSPGSLGSSINIPSVLELTLKPNSLFINNFRYRYTLTKYYPTEAFSAKPPNSSFFGPVYSINHFDELVLTYFSVLLPDYVCYDENLCDFIQPTFNHTNLTCLHRHQINTDTVRDYEDFIKAIKTYFRGCLTIRKTKDIELSRLHSSLYHCQNSSKYISKYRLLDGITDCHMGDDEKYGFSCSLSQMHRLRCSEKANQCFSPIVSRDICKKQLQHGFEPIQFQKFCDGFDDMLVQEIDGKTYTDETECKSYPCDNIYTRCDNIWACDDGRDEDNCINSECPSRSTPCVSPENYTLTCLPFHRINDGSIDCFGASDEFELCRSQKNSFSENTFRCSNVGQCISSSSLCNQIDDCPLDDDEEFCQNNKKICSEERTGNRTEIETILCQLFKPRAKNAQFSVKTSITYPLSAQENLPQVDYQSAERVRTISDAEYEYDGEYESDTFDKTKRCNRGLYVRTSAGSENETYVCFCPPSYYGDFCQFQNQRVSLTLQLLAVDRHATYTIVVRLIDKNETINSYEQFTFVASWGCKVKFNIYLLYSTRPKDISKNYSVRIDAFDKSSLTYYASWRLSIPFAFLPVNRVVNQLTLPVQRTITTPSCNLTCHNGGYCVAYKNTHELFCQCPPIWFGSQCHVPVHCDECSSDSLCVGSINNRSICVCPLNKAGPRCLLPSICPSKICQNGGRCVLIDENIGGNNYICICSDEYYGTNCEYSKRKLKISLDNMQIPSFVQVFISTVFNESRPLTSILIKKLAHNQNTILLHLSTPFHMVFVKISHNYYLAVVQQHQSHSISTSISPRQQCNPVGELFNSTVMTLPLIRRVKLYHLLCQNRIVPWCFFDEVYMCFCTLEHHPNCFEFNHQTKLTCRHNDYCKNGASCFQDHPTCPSNTICICTDCYFGTQCQFYAKGFGLTLDDILRYEIRPNTTFSQQRISVKISVFITMLMFISGITSGLCSCLTFITKNSKQVGCGLYLLASSITSVLTVIVFTVKFWFFVLSQLNIITNRTALHFGCICIEPLLKVFLHVHTWLNACVAVERAITVLKGARFRKANSKRVAKRVILLLSLLIVMTIIHDPIHRELFDDNEEQRTWCVPHYSQYLQHYDSAINLFHFISPFMINLFSALIIIVKVAQQRSRSQTRQNYREHLGKQFAEHKHMLISPLALVILSSPRLIISLMSSCINSHRDPWLFLCGYFISFIPLILIFIVFVLPSELYTKEFKGSIKRWRQSLKI